MAATLLSTTVTVMQNTSLDHLDRNSSYDVLRDSRSINILEIAGTSKWLIGTAIFIFVTGLQILHYFFVLDAPPKGLKRIPGPRSTVPWIGRVHDVDLNAPWKAWSKFATQYGGLCASTIAGEQHVWVSDPQIANELLIKRAKIYSSRPEVVAVPGSNTSGQYLPLLAHGEQWRNQRKFGTMMMTQAYNHKYYGYIEHEAKRFLVKLLENPNDHYALTDRFCGRISARLGYGRPESGAAHCKNAGEFIPTLGPAGPVTNRLPFLKYLPEWLIPSKRMVRIRREKEEKLWKGLFTQVKHEIDLGTAAPTSYARAYLDKKGSALAYGFDEHEAASAVGMLVTVAIFTIGGPLYCFLMCMILFPEWQDKVREEIDEVIGDRVVEVADYSRLPILRAVIKECIRWRPPVPLGVPRLLEADDSHNGYFYPKGAVIHVVDLALARRPTLYPDPEAFRPERWLDPSFPTYKEPLSKFPRLVGHHGFGMGARTCIGIELTEAETLVACGSIVGAFQLKPARDSSGKECLPGHDDFSSNVIGGPLPFKMDVTPRSAEKAARVRRDYEDSVAAEEAGNAFHYRL